MQQTDEWNSWRAGAGYPGGVDLRLRPAALATRARQLGARDWSEHGALNWVHSRCLLTKQRYESKRAMAATGAWRFAGKSLFLAEVLRGGMEDTGETS